MRASASLALLLAGLLAVPALARSAAPHSEAGHSTTDHPVAGAVQSPSTAGYKAAMDRMHAGMGSAMTGDADVDFVRGMIPHHQAAIDMARVELEHGKDPQARALAEKVIAAQEAEIAEMKEWLAKRGY